MKKNVTNRTAMTRKAIASPSVRKAAKVIRQGIKDDVSAFEASAKMQARTQLAKVKQSFKRTTARVDSYIEKNPKKAVAMAALIAAGIAMSAGYALGRQTTQVKK